MTPELYKTVRQALLRASAFESDQSLRAVFADPRLQPWKNNVPQAGSPAARVSAVMAYLHDRRNTQQQSALALLLVVLAEQESGDLVGPFATLAWKLDPSLDDLIRRLILDAGSPSGPAIGSDMLSPYWRRDTAEPGANNPPAADPYTTFDLHISPGGHVVATSIQGNASADIGTDVPAGVAFAVEQVEQRATNAAVLRQLGAALYDWLFPPAIHTHFYATEAVARQEGLKLRVRMRVEPPAIAALPLEFLYWRERGHFLAVDPRTSVSRYLQVGLPPGRVRRRDGPLHMLAIISDPTDLPRVDPDQFEEIIMGALAGPLEAGQLTLQTVKKATRREITSALLRRKPDIVQFIGHGVYKDGVATVALVDQFSGASWLLDDERFVGLFAGHDDNLGLVSLATCESATSDDPQGFAGLAPRLQQRGLPAVLAMQYKVKMGTARVVLEEFYAAVAARKPIDFAIQQARNAVALDFGLDNREFATPVLYLRAEDGHIF